MHFPFSRTIKKYLFKRRLVSEKWVFNDFRLCMIIGETSDWLKYYLPVDLTGKTVLDVGAGQGESARFFLLHGAAKVICVEPFDVAYKYLAENSKHHPIIAVHDVFKLEHLSLPYDVVKVDVEGYEEQILGHEPDKPVICEVHGLQLADKFQACGWRVISAVDGDERSVSRCTRYAFWKC